MHNSVCPDKKFSFYTKHDGMSLKSFEIIPVAQMRTIGVGLLLVVGDHLGGYGNVPSTECKITCARMEFKESRWNAEYLGGKQTQVVIVFEVKTNKKKPNIASRFLA